MGSSHDNFVKYPRTPHLFGSQGTADDKHLGEADSSRFIADESLIVEEKIDGTNVGIHFTSEGKLVLQCRGHLVTEGMHPQYDLFKQWAVVKRAVLEDMLAYGYTESDEISLLFTPDERSFQRKLRKLVSVLAVGPLGCPNGASISKPRANVAAQAAKCRPGYRAAKFLDRPNGPTDRE